MRLLESRLGDHAEELKSNIERRVERIESRITRALVSLGSEPEHEDAGNVVQFQQQENTPHHLPATSAIAALNELNDTLRMTRNHMEALDRSVSRMRRTLSR